MQHSPQEIKSRLDKAVDPEGNVRDMVAVLELITTLERLPLTREALETTRIGKTINLLRKKTNNSDLAKRAKKLVKKWQKLVINQLEATRSIDSPLNGSRIASPQINGAIKDGKPSTTDKILKAKVSDETKKGLKRKRSTSSLSNSPLTLSQDTSPYTPSDNSSNPSSPFTTIATTELLAKESSLASDSKRQKITVNTKEKNGGILGDQTLVNKENQDDEKSSLNTTDSNSRDVNININTSTTHDINNSQTNESHLNQSLDSFHNDSGIDSLGSHVNTPLSSQQQLTPSQDNDVNSIPDTNVQKELKNDNLYTEKQKDELVENSIAKNGLQSTREIRESTAAEPAISNSLTPEHESVNNTSTSETTNFSTNTSVNNLENSHDISDGKEMQKETSNENEMGKDDDMEIEKMEEESTEPKELVLDLDQEANGINGRFNEQGTWYSWMDVMPYNDGSLQILPYVILD